MEQIHKQKPAIWVLAGICVICLVVAAVAAVLLLQKPAPGLYWNADAAATDTAREPDAEGLYRIQFKADGEPVEYFTGDAALVQRIDALPVLGLSVDDAGMITAVSEPEALYETLADQHLVQRIDENALLLNTSIAFNGAQKTVKLSKNCKYFDAEGNPVTPQIMDEVLIYGTERQGAVYVIVTKRVSDTKLYWRLTRSYNAKEQSTAREPDENGMYTLSFSVDGEQVQLPCRDKDVVTQIDAPAASAAAMGLQLDEDGCITAMQPAYRAIHGKEACALYDVVSLEGSTFRAVNKQHGTTYGESFTATLGEDCRIFDVSSASRTVGECTDSLRVGDRITAYADSMGVIRYVYVHVRIVDSPVYFNITRMYKSPDTTREPDAEGWYVFDIASDGQLLKLKTQDREIARNVDMYSAKAVGLKLNGDVIEDVYSIECVTGNSALASGRYVCSIEGSIVATKASGGSRQTAVVVSTDCKIYDVTGNPGTVLGEETTLQMNDRVNIFGTADGMATHIFVTKRDTEARP